LRCAKQGQYEADQHFVMGGLCAQELSRSPDRGAGVGIASEASVR
jgi:hypothetical protein